MIFRPELAGLILSGAKTVTRRRFSDNPRSPWFRERCALLAGREYAVQPGRGKPSVCRVLVTSVRRSRLGVLSDEEAEREGFALARDFRRAWEEINGDYDPDELVWRVAFERSGRTPPLVLYNAAVRLAWELRSALASGRTIRLILSERCDGVLRTADGQRILEGRVQRVSPTGAFVVIARRHVPMSEVLAISRTHFTQGMASDSTDVLEREAEDLAARLSA